jgi:uncharacterized protein
LEAVDAALGEEQLRPYFWTYSGILVHPRSPRPEEINIVDVAHSLSMICRFYGHTTAFYSVAQHSVLVSQMVPEKDALWGLLHDASEAYLGDMAAPLKRDALMWTYRELERRMMRAVCRRFGLSRPSRMPGSVALADRVALATEFRDVTTRTDRKWIVEQCGVEPMAGYRIQPWQPACAEQFFLQRFEELLHDAA